MYDFVRRCCVFSLSHLEVGEFVCVCVGSFHTSHHKSSLGPPQDEPSDLFFGGLQQEYLFSLSLKTPPEHPSRASVFYLRTKIRGSRRRWAPRTLKCFSVNVLPLSTPGPVGGLGGEESLEGLRLCSGAAESREAPPGSEESRQRGPCLTHCWTSTAAPSSG